MLERAPGKGAGARAGSTRRYGMRSTLSSVVHTAQALRWVGSLFTLGLCILAARAGEWKISRTVEITVAGGVTETITNCPEPNEPSYEIGGSETGTFPQPDPEGLKYFDQRDWMAGWLAGVSDPALEGTARITYTVTYEPDSEEDEPPSRIVLILGGWLSLDGIGPVVVGDCCPGEGPEVGGVHAEALARVLGEARDGQGSVSAGCDTSEEFSHARLRVLVRVVSMVKDQQSGNWSGSTEVEAEIGIKEELVGEGAVRASGFWWSTAEVHIYPAEPGFLFPAFSLPSGPGGGCECGILTIEPLSGTVTAGGEFVVFSGTIPLRSQRQDDDREAGDPGTMYSLFPPPFGNMSHWLSMRVEPGRALLDYWTPNTFTNDVDPAGRLGFAIVPARTSEAGVGSPSASARAGVLASTTQGLTSLTDPDIGDFAVDATGARIRFGSYNGAERVESNLSFVTGGSTITNAGPPGRIASRGGWTYTFGLYTDLTDNVPIHLLTGITDPFGNVVSINHEQRTATFSWSGETWTWDLYTNEPGGPSGYLRMLERPGERFTFTWTADGRMAGYGRYVFDPGLQDWQLVEHYSFGWNSAPGGLLRAEHQVTGDCQAGCNTTQIVGQEWHSATPFASQNEPHLVAFTDRFGHPKMQATAVGFEGATVATNLTRYQSGRDYMVTATDQTGKTSTTRLRTETDVTGIPRVSEIHSEGAVLVGAGTPSRTVVTLDQYDRAIAVEWDTEAGPLANGYELTYDGYSQRIASVRNRDTHDTWTVSWATAGGEPVVGAVTDPTSISWQFSYGQRGNPAAALTTMTSPWGAHWLFDYNGIGQLKQTAAPGRASDVIQYYGEEQQDPQEYLSLPKRYTDPTGRSVYFEAYDLRKNLTKYSFEDDALNKIGTLFEYDAFGNLSTITHTDQSQASFTYGGGLLTKVTDEVDRKVYFDRYPGGDNPGKLRSVAFDQSHDDLFAYLAYDAAGRLTHVWDGLHATNPYEDPPPAQEVAILSYDYGQAGELVSITHHNADEQSYSTERFYYNAEGTLRERETTDGRTIGYLYDPNREWLTGIDYPNDPDVTFTYDAAGRLEYVDDGPGAIDYVYDAYKRLWKVIRTFDALANKQYVIEYFYNPDGTVQKTKSGLVAGGTDSRLETHYTLDDAGRMTALQVLFPASPPPGGRSMSGGIPVANTWTWTYDRAGRLKTETDPTGVVTTYTYKPNDDKSFLQRVETKNGAVTLMRFDYTDYPDASVASVTETIGGGANGTVSYEYDHRAQLQSDARSGGYAFYRGYQYDRAGNLVRLDFDEQGRVSSAWTSSYNQLQSVSGALSYGLAYGADGAVAGLDDGSNQWTYAYDDENRLKEVRRGANLVYTCVYDAFGRPAVETLNGATRYLVWEGDELLLEVAPGTGAVVTRHVWGAGGYQGYFRNEGSTPTRLALRDGLGHVRGLMNTSKAITDRYLFDAYGNDVAANLHNTTEGNSLRFRWNGSYGYRTLYLLSGQQSTNTATVMHVGARHYSPSLHRWLQRDPIRLRGGSPNLYTYCASNPVSFVDPSGLCQLILYVNPGGAGMGSHLLVGLVDNSGNVTWVSFYPEDPARMKKKQSEGPGHVSITQTPTRGGRGVVFDITDDQYGKLLAAVIAEVQQRVEGRGKKYDLSGYNCVDWADELFSMALGTEPYPERQPGRVTKPSRYLDWFPGSRPIPKLGEWRPGDVLPVQMR
ncbi:MAG: hypothetical protein AMXMBFR61_04140 [Fimbriimonadales bacterium]